MRRRCKPGGESSTTTSYSSRRVRLGERWENPEVCEGGVYVNTASVCLARMAVTDSDMETRVIPLIEQQLLDHSSPRRMFWVNLDLSENCISDLGIGILSDWWVKHLDVLKVRSMKLYKNNISDEGAFALAKLIANHKWPIEEIHLSHNNISDRGAEKLMKAFLEARTEDKFIYPRLDTLKMICLPVWIRLEYNRITDCESVLSRLTEQAHGQRTDKRKIFCFAEKPGAPSMKDPGCSPKRCSQASTNHSPLFHLFSFTHQLHSDDHSPKIPEPKTYIYLDATAAKLLHKGQIPTPSNPFKLFMPEPATREYTLLFHTDPPTTLLSQTVNFVDTAGPNNNSPEIQTLHIALEAASLNFNRTVVLLTTNPAIVSYAQTLQPHSLHVLNANLPPFNTTDNNTLPMAPPCVRATISS